LSHYSSAALQSLLSSWLDRGAQSSRRRTLLSLPRGLCWLNFSHTQRESMPKHCPERSLPIRLSFIFWLVMCFNWYESVRRRLLIRGRMFHLPVPINCVVAKCRADDIMPQPVLSVTYRPWVGDYIASESNLRFGNQSAGESTGGAGFLPFGFSKATGQRSVATRNRRALFRFRRQSSTRSGWTEDERKSGSKDSRALVFATTTTSFHFRQGTHSKQKPRGSASV